MCGAGRCRADTICPRRNPEKWWRSWSLSSKVEVVTPADVLGDIERRIEVKKVVGANCALPMLSSDNAARNRKLACVVI
jgi:hypothetical protein